MSVARKLKPLKAEQLSALPISIGEARKLLNVDISQMSDDDVARKILLVSELAHILRKTLDLQK